MRVVVCPALFAFDCFVVKRSFHACAFHIGSKRMQCIYHMPSRITHMRNILDTKLDIADKSSGESFPAEAGWSKTTWFLYFPFIPCILLYCITSYRVAYNQSVVVTVPFLNSVVPPWTGKTQNPLVILGFGYSELWLFCLWLFCLWLFCLWLL